jgi:hypothetical protein
MFRKLVVLLALFCAPYRLLAWGVLGHRAVARIAENHLSPAAKREVARLLGRETMPLVSTWADELRNDPQFKDTAPWHYVNVPAGLDYTAFAAQLKATVQPAPALPTNAYAALLQVRQDLKDPKKTAEEKRIALKFLIHLVGDVHQPLHLGHLEDKGGNTIQVSWRGRDTNLHSIWDGDLVEYPGFTFTEMTAAYDRASSAQIKEWQKSDPTAWLFESYQLCAPIYASAATPPTKFDWHFYPTFGPTVEDQILKAGIRLAGMLNEVFDK